MTGIIETILIIGGIRIAEILVNKGVEHSKFTANTWDDILFKSLKVVTSTVSLIFTKKKK